MPIAVAMAPVAHIRQEHGFTLVEVMVAMVILVVGLLGGLSMYSQAATTSTTTQAREQGVALERELLEAARDVPYAELTPNTIVSRVRSGAGLADADTNTAGWQIKRRNILFTVAMGVCSVDDPQDKLGAQDPATFCQSGASPASAAPRQTPLGS